MIKNRSIYLNEMLRRSSCDSDVARVIEALAETAAKLSVAIADQSVPTEASTSEQNGGGDQPQPLDLFAHDLFVAGLAEASVRAVVSEEAHEIVNVDPTGEFLVAIDPLDGSSNIAINAPLGTIFSIRRVESSDETLAGQFLAPGRSIVAAGYILYSSATSLVMSTGDGVVSLTLQSVDEDFALVDGDVRIPLHGREFAINVSNYRHWDSHVSKYIDDLMAGADGAGGVDYNMRWVAALVAEAHRVLTRGGVFLYPCDSREGYVKGRLRLLYEAQPIAFLIEQAGGVALDGQTPILDKRALSLHERTPLVFGGVGEINRFESYRDARPYTGEMAPLFASRGLFRS